MFESLRGDDRELFQKYVEMQSELNRLTAVKNFMYGFKLGLAMTAETFVGMDDLYT